MCILPVALCGSKTWTMNKGEKHMEVFEMWSYRRLTCASWIEKVIYAGIKECNGNKNSA